MMKHQNSQKIFALLFFFCVTACSGGSSSSSSGDSGGDSSSASTGTINGALTLSDSVSLALSKGNGLEVKATANVRVVVEDDESLYDDTDEDGNFTISNVPSGTKCIHASAQAIDNQTYGFRMCDISVGESGETAVGASELTPTGAISGTAQLSAESDHQGILVYVPGTSYDARTDADGTFTMTGLPAGDYALAFEKDGFTSYNLDSVVVVSGETTSLNTVTLLPSESCGDGEILSFTSVSQSAQSVERGTDVTFTIAACTAIDGVTIDYEWYLGTCPDGGANETSVGTGGSYTLSTSDRYDGETIAVCGKAYIDENNVITADFSVTTAVSTEDEVELAPPSFGTPLDLRTELSLTGGQFTTTVALASYEDGATHLYGAVTWASTLGHVYFFRSDDGGATFAGQSIASCDSPLNSCIDYTDIAVDESGAIFLVWRQSHTDIYIVKSTDGGQNFSAPIKVSDSASMTEMPSLAVSNGKVFIAWDAGESAVFVRSLDGGTTYETPVTVVPSGGHGFQPHPQVVTNGSGDVYISWYEGLASWFGNMWLTASHDDGATFANPVQMNHPDDVAYVVNWGHGLALDEEGILYAVWGDARNNFPQTADYVDLYAAKSTDDGASFNSNVAVATGGLYDMYPSLTAGPDGTLAVCWDNWDSESVTGMMVSRSSGGLLWSPRVDANTVGTADNNQACAVASDGEGRIYVVWRTTDTSVSNPPDDLYFTTGE